MWKGIVWSIAAGGTLSLIGCAAKEVAPPPPPQVVSTEKQPSPDRLERSNMLTVTAVVTAIDMKSRVVTLKGPDGNETQVTAGPEVRNLAQVKKGDQVVVSYYESMVFQLRKPGEAQPGVGMAEMGDRAKLGEMPGAMGARAVTVTATVQAVDKKKPSITLKGPDGKVVTLPVKDASRLDPVKVGDLLEITYTEGLAIAVEKPGKK